MPLLYRKEPLRGYWFFNAAGGVCSEAGALGVVEGADGLDEANGADGYQIVLIPHGAVIFFNDVRHQAKVVLNEGVASLHIVAQMVCFQAFPLLGGCQRPGEGTGIDHMERHVKNMRQGIQKFKKHNGLPPITSYPMRKDKKACLSRAKEDRIKKADETGKNTEFSYGKASRRPLRAYREAV